MQMKNKKVLSVLLAFALLLGTIAVSPAVASAAKQSITLDQTKLILYPGETETISVKSVKGLKSTAVKFSSSDKGVATVTSAGKVKAKSAGTAKITATSKKNKSVTAVCKVKVRETPAVQQVILKTDSATVYLNETVQITVKNVKGASTKDVTFSSSNESVATVDSTGLVTGIAVGSATITVQSVRNSKLKAEFQVTVEEDKSLTYEDFDVSGLYNGGATYDGVTYPNFLDYRAAGGKSTHFIAYTAGGDSYVDADIDYKTYRGIGLGSTYEEVIEAYGAYAWELDSSGYTANNTPEHTAVKEIYYVYPDNTAKIGFAFDQNNTVMKIAYQMHK